MTCDDFQIAFDQQRAGVTPAIAADELAAHISGCPACTAYVSLSEQVAAAMTTALLTAPTPPAADSILARVVSERRRVKFFAVITPLSMFALVLILHLRSGFELRSLFAPLASISLGMATGIPLYLMRLRRLRGIELAAPISRNDAWRADLTRKLRLNYVFAAVMTVFVTGLHLFSHGLTLPRGYAALSECSLLGFVLIFIYSAHVIRRQLAALPD